MPEEHLTEYRTAQIAYLLAAVNSDPKKSPPKLTEFMPFFAQEEEDVEEDDGMADYLAKR